MITVEQACEIVCNRFKIPFVSNILEIKEGFIISLQYENGEVPTMPSTIVYKSSGEIGVFFYPHHKKEFKRGKSITIPERFKFKK